MKKILFLLLISFSAFSQLEKPNEIRGTESVIRFNGPNLIKGKDSVERQKKLYIVDIASKYATIVNPVFLGSATLPSNTSIGSVGPNEISRLDSINYDINLSVYNIAELKTKVGKQSQVAYVSGYYSYSDGGGGSFIWRKEEVSPDNGGTIISVSGVANGRWVRILNSNQVNVRWFGAKGDWNGVSGTDDYLPIQKTIDFSSNIYETLIPSGNFLVSNELVLSVTGAKITGNNEAISLSKIVSNDTIKSAFKITQRSCSIQNITITSTNTRYNSNSTMGFGILMTNGDIPNASILSRTVIKNVFIEKQPASGIYSANGCEYSVFEQITIADCRGHGFVADDGTLLGYTNHVTPPFHYTLRNVRAIECGGYGFLLGHPSQTLGGNGLVAENIESLGCCWDVSKRISSKHYQILLYQSGTTIINSDIEDQQYAQVVTASTASARVSLAAPSQGIEIGRTRCSIINPFFSSLVRSINIGVNEVSVVNPIVFAGTYGVLQNPSIEVTTGGRTNIDISATSGNTTGASLIFKTASPKVSAVIDGKTYVGRNTTTALFEINSDGLTERTISGGTLQSVSEDNITVVSETGTSDDMGRLSFSGGIDGMEVTLKAKAGHVITIANNTTSGISKGIILNTSPKLLDGDKGNAVTLRYSLKTDSFSEISYISNTDPYDAIKYSFQKLTTVQMNAITPVQSGMLIYNTDINSICYYNGTNWARYENTVTSIANLKLKVGIVNGDKCYVSGYYSINDGGEDDFYWNSTSVEADNGGTIIQVTGVATGRWYRVIKNKQVSVKQFGAKGDWNGSSGTDDRARIQACIDFAELNKFKILGTPDSYLVLQTVKVGSNCHIDFRGGTLVRGWQPLNGDGSPMNPVPQSNKRINCVLANKDIAVSFATKHTDIRIENMNFSNPNLYFGCFLALYYVEGLILDNLRFERTVSDWNTAILANNVTITRLSINQADNAPIYEDGIHLLGGKNWNISNCYTKTGDDCIAITPLTNESIENVNINNITVDSNSGFAVKIVNEFASTTAIIRNINISNVTGRAGKSRNGSIAIYNNATAYGVNNNGISEIRITNLSTTGNDTTTVPHTAQGIYLAYCKKIYLENVSITGSQKGIYVDNCEDIKFNNVNLYNVSGIAGNVQAPILLLNSNRISFYRSTLPAYTVSTYFAAIRMTNVSEILIDNCLIPNLSHSASIVGVYIDGTNTGITVNNCIINHTSGTNYAVRVLSGTSSRLKINKITTNITPYFATDGNEMFSKHPSATVSDLQFDKMQNSVSYTLPVLAAGATTSTTVTVGNANIGDNVNVSFSAGDPAIISTRTSVLSANTVTVVFKNESASPTVSTPGTLSAKIIR